MKQLSIIKTSGKFMDEILLKPIKKNCDNLKTVLGIDGTWSLVSIDVNDYGPDVLDKIW